MQRAESAVLAVENKSFAGCLRSDADPSYESLECTNLQVTAGANGYAFDSSVDGEQWLEKE